MNIHKTLLYALLKALAPVIQPPLRATMLMKAQLIIAFKQYVGERGIHPTFELCFKKALSVIIHGE